MAEQKPKEAAAVGGVDAAPARKRLPIKTFLVMTAVLLIEGVAISAAFMIAGKPADVKAEKTAATEAQQGELPVEKLVIAEKFQNNRTGKTYLYDTEIYIIVKSKDDEAVTERIEAMSAQIAADIATIFRRAEPAHLLEPTLATLTRQLKSVLDERIGRDAEDKSMVREVLMKKYTQYRADAY